MLSSKERGIGTKQVWERNKNRGEESHEKNTWKGKERNEGKNLEGKLKVYHCSWFQNINKFSIAVVHHHHTIRILCLFYYRDIEKR